MTQEQEQSRHVPVMMKEALDALHLRAGMTVVDATLGGGSYTRAMHEKIMPGGRVIAIDRDREAIERFAQSYPHLVDDITLVHKNYAQIRTICNTRNIQSVDAIVADLGVSSDQLEHADRGFSFLHDGPIDMRMDQTTGSPAAEIVNHSSLEDLIALLRTYGDERHARRIASAIIDARPLETTGALSQVITQALHHVPTKRRLHPATKTFQALRIAVNEEYKHLEKFLYDAVELLVPGGYMSVVSFHSGEDRIVKNIFRAMTQSCQCPQDAPVCTCTTVPRISIISRRGGAVSTHEKGLNPRSRSARLRVIQKIKSKNEKV